MRFSSLLSLVALATASGVFGTPTPRAMFSLENRQSAGEKLVFAHIIVGIISNRRSADDWDADMVLAKSYGIDAFALNIATDAVNSFNNDQLNYAYESAARNGMKVFISFDYNYYQASDAGEVSSKVSTYGVKDGQLKIDGKVFVSSFIGVDKLDVAGLKNSAGLDLYVVPNFYPGADYSAVDGAFNWAAWPSDGNNNPPTGNVVTVKNQDDAYNNALGDKAYMAPASPWFSTHYGGEVSYPKNWIFPSDLLWFQRWLDILVLKPEYVEITTWNDYGESHYVGPLSSKHYDDGASKWVNDMPHTGWLDMAAPFISAYKSGSSTPSITEDKLVYWYRPTPKSVSCDGTDNAGGRPNGFDLMEDNVFLVSLLTAAGTVTVNSGGTVYTFDAPAGAAAISVPFSVGTQSFALSRNGAEVASATSLKQISSECVCGIYNFNAYVGTVPAASIDSLDADGLSSMTVGQNACAPTPSLPSTPPQTAAATATITATAVPTNVPV